MSVFPWRASAAIVVVIVALAGCAHTPDAPPSPPPRSVSVGELSDALPASVTDRTGWATDIVDAIERTNKTPTAERACAVAAIIGQESGFHADPGVAHLPQIVRDGLTKRLTPLGPLAAPAMAAILEGTPPGSTTPFRARVDALKTERDLDRFFRDIAAAYRQTAPGTFAVAQALAMVLGKGAFESLNPVTTAGSMQVKVSFARQLGATESKHLDDDDVIRDLLYTRAGGVRFGTARLISYPASYTDIRHRFADYNAGVYASRNAAFQTMLSTLTGTPLALDGDVLAWDADGDVKDIETNTLKALLAFGADHGLSPWRIRRDARQEKTEAFEGTDSWKAVRAAWTAATGKPAPYAQIPEVSLSSPKMTKPRTTAWFATSVNTRYLACRARLP